MKLKKLRIQNFLSIKDITINFTEYGVFHLYGANNIGKSAVVKAIRALFLNISNNQYKEYLRDDCTTFVVSADTWSGDKIKLSRGSTDYYEWTINGVDGRVDKTGGRMPDVVKEYVNMYVDEQKTKECLNIRLPRTLLPFVDMSAGDNYHLIQKALGTEEYLLSMRLSERKRRETRKEVSVIEEYQEREKDKLTTIEGVLAEERTKVERVEEFESVLKKEYGDYKAIEEVVLSAQDLQVATDKKEQAKENLKELDTEELREELDNLEKIEDIINTMRGMARTNSKMKDLEEKIKGDGIGELRKEVEELKEVEGVLQQARKVSRIRKDVKESKETFEKSDKLLGDFMRENKFCPIVAKTLDKKCPFSEVEGVMV